MADGLRVESRPRVLVRNGRTYSPVCPTTGCQGRATHEVKDGPKMIGRWCEQHAHEEAEARS